MTRNPYADRPAQRFWRQGVVEQSSLALPDIYDAKWQLDPDWAIATAGSCFAQHIARNLRQNGAKVIDMEPAPNGLSDAELQARFGYGLYSARFGNIYTARQLRQLFEEAAGVTPLSDHVWLRDGRYYDALRPNVEPDGLVNAATVAEHRAWHVARVREMMKQTDLFVFTLGLTEAWVHISTGAVFPTAPGVLAGDCDPELYRFHNFTFAETLEDLTAALSLLNEVRGQPVHTMLTVSPVPLTATAASRHVLLSTTYSKAVLRAVAGQVAEMDSRVDYFPSYEIVTNPAARGVFFAANLRSVTPQGVDVVMRHFFAAHPPAEPRVDAAEASDEQDAVCEEAMLEAFGE